MIDLDADAVVHQATNYLESPFDVLGEAVIVNDPALANQVGFLQFAIGAGRGAAFAQSATLLQLAEPLGSGIAHQLSLEDDTRVGERYRARGAGKRRTATGGQRERG